MRLRGVHLSLWIEAVVLSFSIAHARSYYVSTTGSDANPGTLELPFLTIQRASTAAQAGDTVNVRAGIYRETVTPPRSGTQSAPITYQAYNNESVTVSGADIIPANSWTLSSGRIYRAPLTWDLGDGNQIFLDGQMMIEARWPNTTLDISHPTVALTSSGSSVDGGSDLSTGTITGGDLPSKAANYWSGATIHISPWSAPIYQGPGWFWQTGTVGTSSGNQISFRWSKRAAQLVPGPKNPYYLTGKLSELDAGGEWFRDGATSTLYFQTPAGDNPAQHLVEAKHRQFAFDLRGRSYVTVQGFSLFASTVMSDGLTQYAVLDGLKAQYVSHYSLIAGTTPNLVGGNDSGIVLNGKNNVLRNSSIAFSAGNGVTVIGSGQRVYNNVIRDVNYAASLTAPISVSPTIPTSGFVIAWNTMYNSGHDGLRFSNNNPNSLNNGRILHNDIYNYGIQTSDMGCIHALDTDGKGTEIAYNLCHDSGATLGEAFYLDYNSSNFVVHHNVAWTTSTSLRMNGVSSNNKVYNNTFAATERGLRASPDDSNGSIGQPGSELKNNIFTASLATTSGAVLQNNILPGTDPQFVNPAQNNFQLKATSPAIGAGVAISPYTNGFTGRTPDAGAYDHGLPPWKAGGGQAIVSPLSAASYEGSLAPASIAVAFGPKLGTGGGDASSATLPTMLAGTTVTVTDGAGVDRSARLFYVRPAQLAFEVPADTAPGIALITVTSGDGTISLGSAPVFASSAGLFSANASGIGVAAANLVRGRADGSQISEAVATFNSGQNQFVPLPIDRGAVTDQLILVLYGTGIRNHGSSPQSVLAQVGGINAQVLYAGAQSQFPGLDQVNILLPRTLPAGVADIALTVDGQPTNTVTIAMR